ncbi:MAG: hypothetical protein Q9166_001976 [cf. Caloplaca sp. 2 TL-2023]
MLEATADPSTLDPIELVPEELDCRDERVFCPPDTAELVEAAPVCDSVIKPLDGETDIEVNEFDADTDIKLLSESVLGLGEGEGLGRLAELPKPVEDRSALEAKVELETRVELDERGELESVALEVPEVDDTLEELVTKLDAAILDVAVEEVVDAIDGVEDELDVALKLAERLEDAAEDVDDIEDESDVVVRLTKRLEDAAEDVVALASDEDALEAVELQSIHQHCPL